jgi:hypothetical protein
MAISCEDLELCLARRLHLWTVMAAELEHRIRHKPRRQFIVQMVPKALRVVVRPSTPQPSQMEDAMPPNPVLTLWFRFVVSATGFMIFTGCQKGETNEPIRTAAAMLPVASETIQWAPAVPPPSLLGSSAKAQEAAGHFVEWAMASRSAQKPAARAALNAVRTNRDVAEAFFEQAKEFRDRDPARSLVALALLGEMRSSEGFRLLTTFLGLPRANVETKAVHGIATTFVGTHARWHALLAAKAIDGVAYLASPESDAYILAAVRSGDTPHLRTAAADAYIWNHGDSEKARSQILRRSRPDERWIRDRFRRYDDETPQSFDAKILEWMRKYPNFVPPKTKPSSGDKPAARDTAVRRRSGGASGMGGDRREATRRREGFALVAAFESASANTQWPPRSVSAKWVTNTQRPLSHCPPMGFNSWDNLYLNSYNGATRGAQEQADWRTFIAEYFSIVQGDWGNDGFPDLVNPQRPYMMMANSAFLITYAMTSDPGFTFHDPRLDYFELAQGHGGRFKDDLFYAISTGDGSVDAQWEWQAGPSPDRVMTFCPMFDSGVDPASRAAMFLHEAWHGWQWRYHWQPNTWSGHLPIAPPDLPAGLPPGNCQVQWSCDYFTLHRVSLFPPGQMEYSTPNPGPDQKMHSPYQIEVEFLCDLAQRHVPSFPMALEMAARSQADYVAATTFLNPVPFGCGNRRPF